MSKKVKIFVVIVLIAAVGIGASIFFGKTTETVPISPDSALSSSASKAAGIDFVSGPEQMNEFASILSTIKSITIDTSIFENAAYKTLRDYPITLGTDIKGRPNPFAPVGYDVGTISGSITAQKVQFETLQPKVTSTTAEFGAQALLSSTTGATVVFEYGTNDLLGSGTAPIPLSQNGTALLRVNGLLPATTYFVRAVLIQGAETTAGDTMTFTTLTSR